MHRVDNPVNSRIMAYGFVLRIDKDDLKVLVGGVLIDPVGVEHTQVGTTATDTFLSSGFERPLVFELIHTLVCRLSCTAIGINT